MPRTKSVNIKSEVVIGDDNVMLKSLKVNPYKWRMLCQRHIKHYCLFESPVTYCDNNYHFAVKFEKHEIYDTQQLKTLFQAESVKIGLPWPLKAPNDSNFDVDSCCKLVQDKNKYFTDLSYFKNLHKSYKVRIETARNNKFAVLPKYLVDISKGRIKDPDPFFQGSYNWYFTGGLVDSVNIGDDQFVVTAGNDEYLSFFNANDSTECSTYNCGFDVENSNPIHNLKLYELNGSCITLLRQRNAVHLLRSFLKEEEINSEVLWSKRDLKASFTDFKMNLNRLQLTTFDTSHSISLTDLESNNLISEHNLQDVNEKLTDNLGQLNFFNDDTLLCLNRKRMNMLDLRSGNLEKFDFDLGLLACDRLCTFAFSKFDKNHVYVTTWHNIIKMDIRKMAKTTKTFLNKWSHMMKTPPVVVSTVALVDSEYIYLCGSNYADKVLLIDGQKNDLPRYVSNLNDTLNEFNLKGNVNFSEEAVNKVKLLNAGAVAVNTESSGLKLYTRNSAGDIFEQKLSKDSRSVEDFILFENWLLNIPKKGRTLEVTGVANMSPYFFAVAKADLDKNYLKKLKTGNKNAEKLKEDFYEMNISEDPKFKAMNSVWEDESEFVQDDEKSREIAYAVTPKRKVTEWLQSTTDAKKDLDLSLSKYLNEI